MNEKNITTMQIDINTKARLKAIGKQHKKKFLNDVVVMLIDYYERTKEQKPMESLPKAKAQSDISISSESLKERAEKNPMLKEVLEKIKEPTPPPPCNYCSKGYFDKRLNVEFVFCDNPTKKGKSKMAIAIPIEVCLKCWERRQWVKSKMESKPEPKPQAMIEPKLKPQPHKTFGEKMKDGTLEWECKLQRKTMFLKDVPCLFEALKCPFKECEERINKLIVSYMRGEKIEQEI